MAMDLHYYNGDCTSPKAQAQIKDNFIEILVGSKIVSGVCLDDVYKDKCKAENVKVTCALVPSVKSRKKRSLGRLHHRNSLIGSRTFVTCQYDKDISQHSNGNLACNSFS